MSPRLICSIVGRRVLTLPRDAETLALAEGAARAAVAAGYAVMTGGKEGAMLAAARAAKQVGGTTIAILPSNDKKDVVGEEWYDFVLPTPFGIVRNVLTASMCDVMVGVPGGSGTLEEMLFAQDFGRTVFQYSPWLDVNVASFRKAHDFFTLTAMLKDAANER